MYSDRSRLNGHAPSQPSQLDHYYGVQRQLQGDIQATNSEIRQLNNRIVKYFFNHLELIMNILRSVNCSKNNNNYSKSIENQKKPSETNSICNKKLHLKKLVKTISNIRQLPSMFNLPKKRKEELKKKEEKPQNKKGKCKSITEELSKKITIGKNKPQKNKKGQQCRN